MALTKPTVITQPFCGAGTPTTDYIQPPATGSSSIQSQAQGWPSIYEQDPPTEAEPGNTGLLTTRQQTNGAFNLYSSILAWLQYGQGFTFEPAVSTANSGYPKGTFLQYDRTNGSKGFVVSQIDNNTDNFVDDPSLIGTNWVDPAEEFVCNLRLSPSNSNSIAPGAYAETTNTGMPYLWAVNCNGKNISLYDTACNTWIKQKFSPEFITISGSLFMDTVYYVYAYSTGIDTIGLELQEWTSGEPDTATQDGIVVKDGDASRLLVGVIFSPDAINLFSWSGRRNIINFYNQTRLLLLAFQPVQCSNSYGETGNNVIQIPVPSGESYPYSQVFGQNAFDALFCSYSSPLKLTYAAYCEIPHDDGFSAEFLIGINSTSVFATGAKALTFANNGDIGADITGNAKWDYWFNSGLITKVYGRVVFQNLWKPNIPSGSNTLDDQQGMSATILG